MNSNYLLILMKLATFILNKISSYFILVVVLCSFSGFSQIIITEITDPQNSSTAGRYVEIYNSSNAAINLSTYYLIRWTNGNDDPQNVIISLNSKCGSSLPAKTFCIISNDQSSTKFLTTYGFNADEEAGTGDEDTKYNFYHISNETGKLMCNEVKDRPLTRSMLSTKDTYILELHKQIYIWIGKEADFEEKKQSLVIG